MCSSDLERFFGLTSLAGVLDVVYNPQRTGICLQAERAGLPFESGLSMLVAQACRSAECFLDMSVEDERIEELVFWLKDSCTNVFFIGMPGVGKTSAARGLAHLLGRPFVDLDDAFRLSCGLSVQSYLRAYGEDSFRAIETKIAAEYGAQSGLVVACDDDIVTPNFANLSFTTETASLLLSFLVCR